LQRIVPSRQMKKIDVITVIRRDILLGIALHQSDPLLKNAIIVEKKVM